MVYFKKSRKSVNHLPEQVSPIRLRIDGNLSSKHRQTASTCT